MKSEKKIRTQFTQALKAHRKSAGYATAYAFFHKCGGQKYFGFSYTQYLRIESGARLPTTEGMLKILNSLTINVIHAPERRNLIESYIRAVLGDQRLLDEYFRKDSILEASNNQVDVALQLESMILSHAARQKAKAVPKVPVESLEKIKANDLAFWMMHFLTETRRELTLQELAMVLEAGQDEIKEAANLLVSVDLVERKEGRYVSRYGDSGLWLPAVASPKGSWKELHKRIEDKILQTDKGPYYSGYFYIALDDNDPRKEVLFEYLRDNARKAYMLRDESKQLNRGKMYIVLTRMHPLFSFDFSDSGENT